MRFFSVVSPPTKTKFLIAPKAATRRAAASGGTPAAGVPDSRQRPAPTPSLRAFGAAGRAEAQAYPAKPVRVVIPWPPGGGNDISGRNVMQKLSESMGQQFNVDNRGGAGGTIGSELVAKTSPDGYTLMVQSVTHVANAHMYKKLPYDALRDFVGVALIDGRFGPRQFEGERWRDAIVTSLMSKIALRRDSAWNARAPGSYPCSIRATDARGEEHLVEIPYPPGFSRGGLDEKIVLDKFRAVTDSILDSARRARIENAVMDFDRHPSAETLNNAIAIEGTST